MFNDRHSVCVKVHVIGDEDHVIAVVRKISRFLQVSRRRDGRCVSIENIPRERQRIWGVERSAIAAELALSVSKSSYTEVHYVV